MSLRHGPVAALLGALLAAAGPPPVPPPPGQTTADCASTTYASDRLVCADAELRALDARLREAVMASGAALLRPVSPLLEAQEPWFRRRSLCAFQQAHRECLLAAYRERLALVEAVGRPPPSAGERLKCRLGQERRNAVLLPDGRLLWGDAAEILAIAWPAGPGPWLPYLRWGRHGSGVTISSLAGTSAECATDR